MRTLDHSDLVVQNLSPFILDGNRDSGSDLKGVGTSKRRLGEGHAEGHILEHWGQGAYWEHLGLGQKEVTEGAVNRAVL